MHVSDISQNQLDSNSEFSHQKNIKYNLISIVMEKATKMFPKT